MSLSHAQPNDNARTGAAPTRDLAIGTELLKSGKISLAIPKLESAVASRPDQFQANFNLGLAYASAGDYSKALPALVQARKLRETQGIQDAAIYNSLGWAYALNGDVELARETLEIGRKNEANMSKDSRVRLYNNLGILYISTGQLRQAREVLVHAEKSWDSELTRANLKWLESIESSSPGPR